MSAPILNPMNPPKKITGKRARWRRVLAVLLVPVGALLIYVTYTLHDANFHVIRNGEAYRSGQMDAAQITHAIQTYGIKSILNLRGENPTTAWHKAEIQTAEKWHVVHYDWGFGSGDELTLTQMDDLVALLRRAPKPILIHCLGGADRSGLAASLYCYAIEGETPEAAHRQLTIWDGHVPLIRPKVTAMDDSFWRYVSNHVAQARSDASATNAVAQPVETHRSP
jgi:protein tyrosine/serine phosphatase